MNPLAVALAYTFAVVAVCMAFYAGAAARRRLYELALLLGVGALLPLVAALIAYHKVWSA